jgi:hypothetical protein
MDGQEYYVMVKSMVKSIMSWSRVWSRVLCHGQEYGQEYYVMVKSMVKSIILEVHRQRWSVQCMCAPEVHPNCSASVGN